MKEQYNFLVRNLRSISESFTCPHPTILIEKLFILHIFATRWMHVNVSWVSQIRLIRVMVFQFFINTHWNRPFCVNIKHIDV